MSMNKSTSLIEIKRFNSVENIVDTLILNVISEFPLCVFLNFIAVCFLGLWIFSGFVNLTLTNFKKVQISCPFGALAIIQKDGEINGSLCWHEKFACNPSSESKEFNWLDLPDHIITVIVDRLSMQKDRIRFGAVCRSWQSVYTSVKDRRKPRLPLLMLATEHNQDKQTRSFYSLTERRVCNTQVPVPANRFCPGYSHGWLVTVSPEFQVSLVDPFNGSNEIQLPPLQELKLDSWEHDLHIGFISKAILSANPTTEPDDFVVLAIYGARGGLAFFKPGNKTWIFIDKPFVRFSDAIYYRDQFYAVNEERDVFACDLGCPEDPKLIKLEVPPPLGYYFLSDKCYLVESGGELLQVVGSLKHVNIRGTRKKGHNYFTDKFEVFKLDSGKMEWIELQNLDGRLLFLGDNTSMSVLASDYPECKPNSIYYTDDNYFGYIYMGDYGVGPHDMGIFCLDDSTTTEHYPVKSNMIYPAPIWVEPLP